MASVDDIADWKRFAHRMATARLSPFDRFDQGIDELADVFNRDALYGKPSPDVGERHFMTRIGEGLPATDTAMAERPLTKRRIVFGRGVEACRKRLVVTRDYIITNRPDLGDLPDGFDGEQGLLAIDRAKGRRIHLRRTPRRGDATERSDALATDGLEIRQLPDLRIAGGVPVEGDPRNTHRSCGHGDLGVHLLGRGPGRPRRQEAGVKLRGQAKVEIDLVRVPDPLGEDLLDGPSGRTPDDLARQRSGKKGMISEGGARPLIAPL
jgi:hypothetical protein